MSGFRLPCINKEMSLRLKVIIKDCCLFLEGDRRFIYIRTVAWVVQEIERKEGKKIEGVMIARCTLYLTFQHIITVPDLIRPISSNTMLTCHGLCHKTSWWVINPKSLSQVYIRFISGLYQVYNGFMVGNT